MLFTRSGVMHLASSHPSIHEPDRLACLLPLPALGPTSPDLNLAALPASLQLGVHAKTRFSMVVPPVERILEQRPEIRNIILVGIEVCCTIIKLNLPSVLTPPEVAHLCSPNGGAPFDSAGSICVAESSAMQLDLRARDYAVHVLADGVSSCNQCVVQTLLFTAHHSFAI